jgi:hypothetical protein
MIEEDIMDNATDLTELANAIVAQACTDYKEAIRGHCPHPKKRISEVLKFFKSEWFELLTHVDPAIIIKKLNRDYFVDGRTLMDVGSKVSCPELNKQYAFTCPLCKGEAKTYERKFVMRLKNGSFKTTYVRYYNCSCHYVEKEILKERKTNA